MEKHLQQVCGKAFKGLFDSPRELIRELYASESDEKGLTWAGWHLKQAGGSRLLKSVLFLNIQVPSHFAPGKERDELMYPVASLFKYQEAVDKLHEPVLESKGLYKKKKKQQQWIGLSDIMDSWDDKLSQITNGMKPGYFFVFLKNDAELVSCIVKHRLFEEGKLALIYPNTEGKFYLRYNFIPTELDVEEKFKTENFKRFWISEWVKEFQEVDKDNLHQNLLKEWSMYLGLENPIKSKDPLRDWVGLSADFDMDSIPNIYQMDSYLMSSEIFLRAIKVCNKYHKIPEISEAIMFYSRPWLDGWDFNWHASKPAHAHNDARNMNALASWINLANDKVDPESSKGLTCYNSVSGGHWANVIRRMKPYPIKVEVLKAVVNKLGMKNAIFSCDDNELFTLPIVPALPFLVSLGKLYHELKPDRVIFRKATSDAEELITPEGNIKTRRYEAYILTIDLTEICKKEGHHPLLLSDRYEFDQHGEKHDAVLDLKYCRTDVEAGIRDVEPANLFFNGAKSPVVGFRFLPSIIQVFWDIY